MPAASPLLYSKSRVNKAADNIRAYVADPMHAGDLSEDFEVVVAFRAAHQLPLTKASMGLRSMVKTEACLVQVSQRLKRIPTILDKLIRQPEMALARMQDVGGCRAVLANIDEVRRVQRRIHRNGKQRRMVDYIATPAPSGYRGVHVIVEYDDRMIEVQLRTEVQHHWAVTVERLGGSLNEDLKSGYGPDEVLNLLAAISQGAAIEEAGGTVDQTLRDEISRLRVEADQYLRGGRSDGN